MLPECSVAPQVVAAWKEDDVRSALEAHRGHDGCGVLSAARLAFTRLEMYYAR